MEGEYIELRISMLSLIKGLVFGVASAVLIIVCLVDSPRDNALIIAFFTVMLLYFVYCCFEQVNWYLRYDEHSFEIRSFTRKTSHYSFDEVKSIRPLRKGAAIISIKGSRKQYEIEPRIAGAEQFFETFRQYCQTHGEA